MLRASQVLLAPFVKKTTGLVGLAVVPNAREVLVRLYEKTLNDVKVRRYSMSSMPPSSSLELLAHLSFFLPWARCSAIPISHIANWNAIRAGLQIIPETAEYRKAVEKFTNYRLDVVKQNEDVSDPASQCCESLCFYAGH